MMIITRSLASGLMVAIAFFLMPEWLRGADVPTPEQTLGFRVGEDNKLAAWDQVVAYCKALDEASPRVSLEVLGQTTEDRPMIAVVVADEATINDLDLYQSCQRLLSHPGEVTTSEAAEGGEANGEKALLEVVDRSKPVVLITCSIHSSETASTLMSLELVYGLATGEDSWSREVRENVITLVVPSMNPDGVDKVAQWYQASLGKPWEGTGMPWLYHKYAGHDTNRDFFMLNLKETQLLTRLLYEKWYPTITYDVHQMGTNGARLFVPPFHDPVNPNVDPRLNQSITLIGSQMAAELTRAGKKGVVTGAMYDNWWNGGNRTSPQRHNMVGILTEAASVRLASPIFLEPSDLKGSERGFPDHSRATNFVDPWPGGWWRLRDIVDYELICARSLLRLASRYRHDFQEQYLRLSQDAIRRGQTHRPAAWVVPVDQTDRGRAFDMIRLLRQSGIEVQRAKSPIETNSAVFPSGSWLLPAAQPYLPHLKDLMERQEYPQRIGPDGKPETPYDVAGWTLPLLMGVEVRPVDERSWRAELEPSGSLDPPTPRVGETENARSFAIKNQTDDDIRLVHRLLAAGVELRVAGAGFESAGQSFPRGSILFACEQKSREVLKSAVAGLSCEVIALSDDLRGEFRLQGPRIGVYQPWVPSMDEGWTRLVLEQFGVPYTALHNADIRSGRLKDRWDVILIPSVSAGTLREGFLPDRTAPEYVGGLDQEGSESLEEFARGGGRVVCLENSCQYAIEEWNLPVKNVLAGLKGGEFFAPGSLVRVDYGHAAAAAELTWITMGMPRQGAVYFDRSVAFEVSEKGQGEGEGITVPVRYAAHGVLESGWLLGPEKIQGKAAVVNVKMGEGEVVLFGFPPQHRGWTRATYRLLFNSLLKAIKTDEVKRPEPKPAT